jgi:hypothetical protein
MKYNVLKREEISSERNKLPHRLDQKMLTILVLFGVNMLLLLLGSFMHNEFILGTHHFFVSAFSNNSISVLKIYIRHFACFDTITLVYPLPFVLNNRFNIRRKLALYFWREKSHTHEIFKENDKFRTHILV